jgi:23S rRNA pseudouridine1911/1915/1917 synthase
MFANGEVHKTYWAIVEQESGRVRERRNEGLNESEASSSDHAAAPWHELTHWLVRNEKQNKSYAYDHEVPNAKKAVLRYRVLSRGERYDLLEVRLLTGRHHQIRCQLAKIGCAIKGDLKYGAPRSNPDGSISLHARRITFEHPVSHLQIDVTAPVPDDNLWQAISRRL